MRSANQQHFSRHTEKLDEIAGQLSFFNEAEACFDGQNPEQAIDEVVDTALKPARRPKKKGQREEELKGFQQEEIPHDVPAERFFQSVYVLMKRVQLQAYVN